MYTYISSLVITEKEYVDCAVRAESSNNIEAKLSRIMPSPFIACGYCLDKCALRTAQISRMKFFLPSNFASTCSDIPANCVAATAAA